jgi:hypothetical protein
VRRAAVLLVRACTQAVTAGGMSSVGVVGRISRQAIRANDRVIGGSADCG